MSAALPESVPPYLVTGPVSPPVECQPVIDTNLTKKRRPAARRRRERETAEYAAGLRRWVKAYGMRIAVGDPDDLTTAVQIAAELDQVIGAAVRAMRVNTGYSWAQVGRALGTTRQAAQQRYGHE